MKVMTEWFTDSNTHPVNKREWVIHWFIPCWTRMEYTLSYNRKNHWFKLKSAKRGLERVLVMTERLTDWNTDALNQRGVTRVLDWKIHWFVHWRRKEIISVMTEWFADSQSFTNLNQDRNDSLIHWHTGLERRSSQSGLNDSLIQKPSHRMRKEWAA